MSVSKEFIPKFYLFKLHGNSTGNGLKRKRELRTSLMAKASIGKFVSQSIKSLHLPPIILE